MNVNEYEGQIIKNIEDVLGIEIQDKNRTLNLLFSDYLEDDKEDNSNKLNNTVGRMGDVLLKLIKAEYIYKNVTTNFETLLFIDKGTQKALRDSIKISFILSEGLKQYDKKNIFNIDPYNILKKLLGIIYIENNYEIVKKIILGNIQEIVTQFIDVPNYNWYKIIKCWGNDNNMTLRFDLVNRHIIGDKNFFEVLLKDLNKEVTGYGETLREARIDAAYKYYQRYIPNAAIEKYKEEMIYEEYNISDYNLSTLRISELAVIKDIEIEDYWLINQCFVHKSYIEENKNTRYKSNECISYLGNLVRYLVIDEFIYTNRAIFEKEYKESFRKKKKEILHPEVNFNLFEKMNYVDYVLMSKKEKYLNRKSLGNNVINALLGAVFIWDSSLNNKFVELYLKHIISYLPQMENQDVILGRLDVKSNINQDISEYKELFYSNSSSPVVILDGGESLNKQIAYLAQKINIRNMLIATGFVYKSGLVLLENIIKTIHEKNGTVELIAGSLQNYRKYKSNDKNEIIIGMDVHTARYLNSLIKEEKLKVKTIEQTFYHGKFFMLEGEKESCFIIGSSNVSNAAFNMNRELNLLFALNNEDDAYLNFKNWYENISEESIEINELDEVYFCKNEIDYFANYSITKIKNDSFLNEIQNLADEEIKFRLKLWMDKYPNSIYGDLGIESLQDYYLFEYSKYNILVLESFSPQNSFYCFRSKSVEELLFEIRGLTKTEIFELSSMNKRGYHISDREKLESNVNMLFTRKFKVT